MPNIALYYRFTKIKKAMFTFLLRWGDSLSKAQIQQYFFFLSDLFILKKRKGECIDIITGLANLS